MGVEVWLTGFEPFGSHDDNISQIIAEMLNGFEGKISLGDARGPYAAEFRESEVAIKAETLSVDEAGTKEIVQRLQNRTPQAIIHLGFAENRDAICIEATAYNQLDFRMPDNSGRVMAGCIVNESGHNLLHSTAPINLIMAEFYGDERVKKSEDPGRFVCNEIYFRTLDAIGEADCRDRIGRIIPVLFVHLPPSDKLALENQVDLVKRIVALTVQRPQMEVVGGMLRDGKNRLLAARRGSKEYMAGFWEFPGGKVELGEEHDAALEREYLEEFGWRIKPLRICEEYSHAWPEMVVHLTFFLCEAHAELPPAEMTSHDEFRWLSEDQLMDVKWLPPDVEFVKRIKERGIANL